MPIVGSKNMGTYWEPATAGPSLQADLVGGPNFDSTLLGTLPTTGTISAAGNWTSNVVQANGFKGIAMGAKSTQTGALNIQRYLDKAGLVPVGPVVTAALVANTAQWLTVNDGIVFQSFTAQITNTGGSAATVTNFGLMLNAG
jgi:hypothetical protein